MTANYGLPYGSNTLQEIRGLDEAWACLEHGFMPGNTRTHCDEPGCVGLFMRQIRKQR